MTGIGVEDGTESESGSVTESESAPYVRVSYVVCVCDLATGTSSRDVGFERGTARRSAFLPTTTTRTWIGT